MKKPHYKITETAGGEFSVTIFSARSTHSFGRYDSLESAKLAAIEQLKLRVRLDETNKVIKEYYFET